MRAVLNRSSRPKVPARPALVPKKPARVERSSDGTFVWFRRVIFELWNGSEAASKSSMERRAWIDVRA